MILNIFNIHLQNWNQYEGVVCVNFLLHLFQSKVMLTQEIFSR